MKAKFIGADGSMGYRHGKTYEIHIYKNDSSGLYWVQAPMFAPPCPYSNMEMVLKNWILGV